MNRNRPLILSLTLAFTLAAAGLAQASHNPRHAGKPAAPAAARENGASGLSRPDFTEHDQAMAEIPSIPDARFWGDSASDFLNALPTQPGPWLALSGGGADGAFGAGLLAGLSETGRRPDFLVVTGVSTGALMAPFAFAGERYDQELRDAYTTINAGDVFEAARTGESLYDTWPLRATIAKYITKELLADIAEEHRRGRRLFVVTTNLDAERPVVWNMGAIAEKGDQAALELFRNVLLASSSLPGLFPPVYVEAMADGKRIREMHVDGGASAPFYVAPSGVIQAATALPITELYVIANTKLTPDFQVIPRNTAAILGRAIAKALISGIRLETAFVADAMRRRGVPFKFSFVPSGFEAASRGAFDPQYMSALFGAGERQARGETAFASTLDEIGKAVGQAGGSAPPSTTGVGPNDQDRAKGEPAQ